MSNWIDSGGDGPHLWTDDDREDKGRSSRRRAPLMIGVAVLLLGVASQLGHARDRGQFANATP